MLGAQIVEHARRQSDAVHRSFVDISGLKKVNEHARHDAGDEVSIVEAMREVTRATDVVARWGGAEFCVVGPVPGMAPLELERRVRDMVALHLPVEPTCGRSGSAPGERCWRHGTRGRWTRCSARPTRS
jgi:diguanylate cyclase (GGDEF)-like protein